MDMSITDITSKLYKLAGKDLDENMVVDYLMSLSSSEISIFQETFDQYYYFKKYKGHKKYKITNNAIQLAIKIKNDTGIPCFPYIERIACKSWSNLTVHLRGA